MDKFIKFLVPISLAAVSALVSAAPKFRYEDISSSGLEVYSAPMALNKKAQITGNSQIHAGDYAAFLTGSDGKKNVFLGSLGGTHTNGYGINNSGLVVGLSYLVGNEVCHAYVTSKDSRKLIDLGTLGGNVSTAWAINDSGEIVGSSRDALDLTYKPFITDAGGGAMRAISLPAVAKGGVALDINNAGVVVGELIAEDNSYSPFVTLPHGVQARSLGTFGGHAGQAFGVNERGQVVGYATDASENTLGFISSPDGGAINQVHSADGRFSWLNAINNHGVAVGKDFSFTKADRAVMTLPGKLDLIVLDTLVEVPGGLQVAADINDKGQIVAMGNNQHVYLLTPIGQNLK